jgi:hypothetical protein
VSATLAAYASGTGGSADVIAALAVSRLLVPVVAVLDEAGKSADGSRTDKASHMATVTTTGRDGRRGLLAFTCIESMSRWQARARPVPVSTRDAAEAALADGAEAVVVDLAGPVVFSIEAADLRTLAAGWRALGTDPGRPIDPGDRVDTGRPIGPGGSNGLRAGIGRLIRRVRR